jgi:hypothetical protein
MLKQKDKIASPISNHGRPKLEEVKIAPVGDLIEKMEKAQAAAVKELNEGKEEQRSGPCNIDCPCEPCREGRCGMCTYDAWRRQDFYGGYYDRGYDRPDSSGSMRSDPRSRYWGNVYGGRDIRLDYSSTSRTAPSIAEAWVSNGGYWDTGTNSPAMRNDEERYKWEEFRRYYERYYMERTGQRLDERERRRSSMSLEDIARQWEGSGGAWNYREGLPYFRDADDAYKWKRFEDYFGVTMRDLEEMRWRRMQEESRSMMRQQRWMLANPKSKS